MTKYYAVTNGRSSGVYSNWSDCKAQVDGYSGNQYRSFSTPEAAQAYMSSGGGGGGSKSHSTASSSSPASSKSVTKHTIYTDGSSKNNQGPNARAGYGVYYGPNDPRNVSERLAGKSQTNNRAELSAVKHAVDNIHHEVTKGKSTTKYSVATDSMYAKNSLGDWGHDWQKNGWKTSKGESVENRDLIEPTLGKIRDINQHYHDNGVGSLEIAKVTAHSTNVGNNMADSLATKGADKGL